MARTGGCSIAPSEVHCVERSCGAEWLRQCREHNAKDVVAPHQVAHTLKSEVLDAPGAPERLSVGSSPWQGFHWETVNPEQASTHGAAWSHPCGPGAFSLTGSCSLGRSRGQDGGCGLFCCSQVHRDTGILWCWWGLPAWTHPAATFTPCPSHARWHRKIHRLASRTHLGGEASCSSTLFPLVTNPK